MRLHPRVRRSFVLSAMLVASACAQDRPAETPLAPTVTPSLSATTTTYTLVHDAKPLRLLTSQLTLSTLIGPTGGKVSLLGHVLTVPKGAVTVPTIFTMLVLPTGFIEVELAALLPILGTDVGGSFTKPVTLKLTYKRSPDAIDPARLLIVRVNGTEYEPLVSTVNIDAEAVSAKLTHFSKYAMAQN